MDRTLDEAIAGFDDDALLKMMVAQVARTFPKFEGAPESVKRARDRFVALASAAPSMREAISGALEWYGRPGESALERFERHAEQFHRAHGMLAPGKSEPMELYGGPAREAERLRLWKEWGAKRTAEVDGALLAALRAADGEVTP